MVVVSERFAGNFSRGQTFLQPRNVMASLCRVLETNKNGISWSWWSQIREERHFLLPGLQNTAATAVAYDEAV